MTIRPTTRADLAALQRLLEATDLFPPELLPDMIGGFLDQAADDELWLTYIAAGQPIGFCYAVQERLTDGTWNMLAIAVEPSEQGAGHGGSLLRHLEETLKQKGQRLLVVDTSGTDAFERIRAFYSKNGYDEEARIRDFWALGDDKITFRKAL